MTPSWPNALPVCSADHTQARGIAVKPPRPVTTYNSFWYLLRPAEQERCLGYQSLWESRQGEAPSANPNVVFHLGDNPCARPCMTSTATGALPSLRKSMGLLWHPSSQTVILPAERLALQGWPMFEPLYSAAGVEPVNHWFASMSGPKMNQVAGNAYHVGAFGTWAMTVLACVRLD